jgi:hypothetical protein
MSTSFSRGAVAAVVSAYCQSGYLSRRMEECMLAE